MHIMDLHRFAPIADAYGLHMTPKMSGVDASEAVAGLCHWSQGTRSPEQGMRASAKHEIAYVVRGRLRVETPDGASFEAQAGDIITTSPARPHCCTAIEDSDVFFVLLDPT